MTNKTAPTAGPIVLTTPAQTAAPEQIELFSIDGTPYFIAKVVPANIMLKFLHKLKTDEAQASAWLLQELLGDDAYEALMNWDGLTFSIFNQIMQAAASHMIDATDQD